MRSPILFCCVLAAIGCASSGSPSAPGGASSGSGAASGSSSGSNSGSSVGASGTSSGTPSMGDDAGDATVPPSSGIPAGGDDGSSEAAEGNEGSPGTSGGGGGDDGGGEGGGQPPPVMGDGGTCGGTVYSAGVACAGGTPSTGTNPCAIITGTHARACAKACTTCPPDHDQCCIAQEGQTTGYDVGGLLLGGKDTVTFTGVYAPADGDYDIVWYYFCGNTDTDNNYPPTCPGSKEGATSGPPGCRQAIFSVNGVDDPTVYEIPCFLNGTPDGMWTTIHSWVRDDPATKALVPFHLKAGSTNTIKIYAGNHDTVDLSGIRVPDGR